MEYNKSNNIAGSKIRNSNIELLRIFAMFAIVMSHNVMCCKIDASKMPLCFNRVFLESMSLGKLGVAIFVMITGYYMCKTTFKISRVINVVLQTLFYSISLFTIFVILDKLDFSFNKLAHSLFPIITNTYWFVTAYVLLLFVVPFINLIINRISLQKFRILVLVFAFWFSFAPTFLDFDAFSFGGHISYFILFYLVGAYLRLYPDNLLSKKRNAVITIVSISLFMLLSIICIDYIGLNWISSLNGLNGKFYTVFSITVLILSASLLNFFANLNPKHSKIINTAGKCTFGVYLIHTGLYITPNIWHLFNTPKFAESPFLIFYVVMASAVVYIGCSIIELLRINIIERYILKKVNQKIIYLAEKIQDKVLLLLNK